MKPMTFAKSVYDYAQNNACAPPVRSRMVLLAFIFSLFSISRALGAPQQTQTSALPASARNYLVYVVCESADKIALISFGPHGAHLEHETHIGLMPMDINGPHGIAISSDKRFVYVSVGHGRPNGSVWKLEAGTDKVIRYTSLGLFPATTDISSDGAFIYVANANFHGDMVPSSISVVAPCRTGHDSIRKEQNIFPLA
jgi:DNA-binding beta-propeller fold protein YncE